MTSCVATLGSINPIGLRGYERSPRTSITQGVRFMKSPIVIVIAAGALALTVTSALAAGPSVAWTKKDMTTAIHTLGYPKPHPRKLSCSGIGTSTAGAYDSFRCKATYRHHRIRRFVIGGEGEGGWLCAGKKVTGCNLLRHGFVTTAHTAGGDMEGVASLAATGYLQNHYDISIAYRSGLCRQNGTSWACDYNWTNNSILTVTITFKTVKGGYTTSAAVTTQ